MGQGVGTGAGIGQELGACAGHRVISCVLQTQLFSYFAVQESDGLISIQVWK